MTSPRAAARFPFSLTLLFVLCLALTGVGAVALVLASEGLTASTQEVERNLNVQRALESLLLALVNAEAGQRGFLLTGQPFFLEPYVDAVAKQAYYLGTLEALTAGDARQRDAIQNLKPLVEERLRQLAASLSAARGDDGARIEAVNRGKETMLRVRAGIDAMRRHQELDLAQRRADVDRHTRYAILILLGTNGAGLLGLALLYAAMRRYHRRRQETQESITRREEAYRALFDGSPLGHGVCDPQSTRFLDANPKLEAITGYDVDALRRTTIVDLLPRASRLDNARAIRELVAGERTVLRLEQPVQRGDGSDAGSTTWLELHLGVLRSAGGGAERLEVVAQDITERKRAATLDAGMEAVLRALTRHTSIVVFVKDVEGRYLYANGALQGALERGDPAIVGLRDQDLFPPPCAAALRATDAAVLRDRIAHTVEHALSFAHETRVYLCTVMPYIDAAGTLAGTIGLGTDITEAHAEVVRLRAAAAAGAEREAAASAATLAAVEQERMRLAMELHDDLGASISAVWVEIVAVMTQLKKLAPQLLIRQERGLEALTRLSQNVQRITAGLHPLLLEHAGLQAALGNYVAGWSSANAVPVDLQVDAGLPALTREEELALFRIVQEAMTNIQKYAAATRVVVGLHATEDGLRLSIRDDGTGIPDEALVNSLTRGIAGMRTRVRALGGTFWIGRRGSEGGTEVTVRLRRSGAGS